MGDMAGLPTLSDQRLIILQKQSKRMRKSITIINDKLKSQQMKVHKLVEKHKASDGFRSWQKTLPYKNSLAEIRGLQKCLKKRRESSTLEPELTDRNGIYDGESITSMKHEIDQVISEKNPRERRLRKVERMKSNGFRDGRIVDYDVSMAKFSDVLGRPKGLYRGETQLISDEHFLPERAVSALDLVAESRNLSPRSLKQSPQQSLNSSQANTPSYSPAPDSPPQFRLPPIQARRSTIASSLISHTSTRRMFDAKSDNSVPYGSMKRSMSFAVAR